MGKYSLENYELYKAHKVRPKPIKDTLQNPGKGIYTRVEVPWRRLEEHPGEYQMERMDEVLRQNRNSLLMINPEQPEWVKANTEMYFGKFIRRLGSYIKDKYDMVGILVTTLKNSHYVWDSYSESFEVPILVPLECHELIQYYQRKEVKFGLYIQGDNDNWIECCETMARYHLSNVWEKRPVVAHVNDNLGSDEFLEQGRRWHVSYTNISDGYGYQFELRRLLFPKEVSSNGYLPLRFWFVNVGTGLCYQPYQLKLKLWNDNTFYIVPLNTSVNQWGLGDITYHEILKLPSMEEGVYQVGIGIFYGDVEINLAIECEKHDGFYQVGTIKVDHQDRDGMANIWDKYYPEGYYPLEDPKEPNT